MSAIKQENFKTPYRVDEEACIGGHRCVMFCPMQAISMKGRVHHE